VSSAQGRRMTSVNENDIIKTQQKATAQTCRDCSRYTSCVTKTNKHIHLMLLNHTSAEHLLQRVTTQVLRFKHLLHKL